MKTSNFNSKLSVNKSIVSKFNSGKSFIITGTISRQVITGTISRQVITGTISR